MHKSWLALFLPVALSISLMAQDPTGTVAGVITDESGGLVPDATVKITNKETGAVRIVKSGFDGSFSAPSLPAGYYEVSAEAAGFRILVRPAQVETGATTTVNITMQVGVAKEVLTIEAAPANINYETNTVQGVVTQQQIDRLPLNGRSYLNLAQLEPGVLVSPANPGQFNAQFSVSVLGGLASRTSITVDGGNVRNPIEGGSGTNFSQEVVQEFQLSSMNFDLSTGITAFGAINVVTRSGGSQFHGATYYYFRDHHTAAYPSLKRNPITNDLFFARRQPGVSIGGPIRKEKLFFFFNYEYTSQAGVYVVVPDLPSLATFQTLAPAPYYGKTFSAKFDYRLSNKTSLFLRYSHDGNHNTGPIGVPVPPSNFVANRNWADQSLLGITTVLSASVVSDLRFSYWYWQNRNIPAPCSSCLGGGGPELQVIGSTNFILGNNFNSPQGRDIRRYPLSDAVYWQAGSHRIKFGGDYEFDRTTGYWSFFDPGRVFVLSPEALRRTGRAKAFGLPASGPLTSASDILKLPVSAFLLGIGDPAQPSYKLPNARGNHRLHFYAQDTWRVNSKFSLNYGLGWEYESNVLNYDLSRPALLSPFLGGNLNPPKHQYRNFEPALGFAWAPGANGKTVIRSGFGIFYDTQAGWWRLGERAVLGGSGRQFIGNSDVANPFNGIPGVPAGSAFTPGFLIPYATFLQMLPTLRAQENALFPGNTATPQINTSKQANALGAIYPHDFPTLQAQHANLGIQRELGGGVVVQADFVFRHALHTTPGGALGTSVDFNHFTSIRGPLIPACHGVSQINSPTAQCSNGPVNFWWPGATSSYRALLLKVDKRFRHRYQFTGSYAYQHSSTINDIGLNLNNYFASYGPDRPRHVLNISGFVDLPWGMQFSLLSSLIGRPPVEPYISGVDASGTNVGRSDGPASGPYTPIPGNEYNGFLSKRQLQNLVATYNSTIAGTKSPYGPLYPVISLPAHYNLSHNFTSQDIRLTKVFRVRERYELRIMAEAFNVFNFGNLTGDNFNLSNSSSFGVPTQRVSSTFGSGGPRAFQFAGRFAF